MVNIVTSRTRERRFRAPNGPWRLALNSPYARWMQSGFLAGPSYGIALSPAGQSLESSGSSNIVHAASIAGWGVRRVSSSNISGELTPSAFAPRTGWNGDATLLFVVWRNNVTGANNRTVFTLRDASGPLYQWKDANGTISANTYYNTSASFTTTGATDTDTAHKNSLMTVAFRSSYNGSTYDQSVWLNGVQDATTARSAGLRTSDSVGNVHTWALPDATGGNIFGSDAFEIAGAVLFDTALSNQALLEFHSNPWFWLEPDVRRVFVPATGGGALSVDNASHAHTIGSATVTAQSTVSADSAAHTHSIAAVSVTAQTSVSADAMAHAHAIASAVVSALSSVSVDAAAHSHAIGAPTLAAQSSVSADVLAHAHAIDTVSLTVAGTLVAEALAHAHAVGSAALTVQSTVSADALAHAHSMGAVAVSVAGALVAEALSHAHAIGSVSVSADSSVSVDAMAHAHAIGQALLVQQLGVDSAAHAHSMGASAVSAQVAIVVSSMLHAALIGSASVNGVVATPVGDIVVIRADDLTVLVMADIQTVTVQ